MDLAHASPVDSPVIRGLCTEYSVHNYYSVRSYLGNYAPDNTLREAG